MGLPGLIRRPVVVIATAGGPGLLPGLRGRAHLSASPDAGEPPALTLLTITQDVWPPRVLLALTGMATWAVDAVTLWREVAGVRTAVRGAADVTIPPGEDALVRVDAELPFGISYRYVAVLQTPAGEVEQQSVPLTVSLPGGKVALSDAISGAAAELVVIARPEKSTGRQATTFVVGGRAVVVTGYRGPTTGVLDVLTETDSGRENLGALLTQPTAGVLQLRQAGGYGGVDCYLAVLRDTERRWSQDGSDPRRVWSLDHVEVEAWADIYQARGFTLGDLADAYPSPPETLLALAGDFVTLLSIALADLGV